MILAGWLVFKAVLDAGVRIQIHFVNAQGLIAGRTTIRYQKLEVGMVRDIKLSEGLDSIYVEADIYPEATKLLAIKRVLDGKTDGEFIRRFWARCACIRKLYCDPTRFNASIGLSNTISSAGLIPSDLLAQRGLTISLKARDLGGISVGSQIVYKKIQIGEVFSYQLDDDAQSVTIQASIKEEYQHITNTESRFWNVCGIGASIGFEGVDVRLESLRALIGGSIAVDSPDEGKPVEQNAQFRLYRDLKPPGAVLRYRSLYRMTTTSPRPALPFCIVVLRLAKLLICSWPKTAKYCSLCCDSACV